MPESGVGFHQALALLGTHCPQALQVPTDAHALLGTHALPAFDARLDSLLSLWRQLLPLRFALQQLLPPQGRQPVPAIMEWGQ